MDMFLYFLANYKYNIAGCKYYYILIMQNYNLILQYICYIYYNISFII